MNHIFGQLSVIMIMGVAQVGTGCSPGSSSSSKTDTQENGGGGKGNLGGFGGGNSSSDECELLDEGACLADERCKVAGVAHEYGSCFAGCVRKDETYSGPWCQVRICMGSWCRNGVITYGCPDRPPTVCELGCYQTHSDNAACYEAAGGAGGEGGAY